jgi:metal transporter CNNM
MTGALTYAKKTVKDVMTMKNDVFMLPVTQTLDFNTISLIFQRGFSRIPVYENTKDNVVGILFTKDLILLDPEDNVSIRSVIHFFSRSVMKVRTMNTLSQVLGLFKSGRCHLAIVVDAEESKVSDMHDPIFVVVGIITIEDIIEDILQTEISDETDEYVNIAKRNRNQNRNLFDIHRLALLDPHKAEETLSRQEVTVIATHLLHNVDVFKSARLEKGQSLTQDLVELLVRKSKVLTVRKEDVDVVKELYKRGRATNVCTFLIEGKVDITVGTEEFQSQLGKFQIIARKALTSFPDEQYVPDFSATPNTSDGMCRFLRIYASDFYNILNPSNNNNSADLPRTSFDLATERDSEMASGVTATMVKTPIELRDDNDDVSKEEEEEEEEKNGENSITRPQFTALEIDESQMNKSE